MALDIRTKTIGFLSFLILTLLFNDPRFLLGLLLLGCLVGILTRAPWRTYFKLIGSLIPFLLLIMVCTSFNINHIEFVNHTHDKVICSLGSSGSWNITQGGTLSGVSYMLRIMIFILVTYLIQIKSSQEELFQLCYWLRLPHEISFLLVTSLRFIPVLNRKRIQIMEAQTARGACLPAASNPLAIRSFLPLVIPLFASSIQMSNTLSMAMVSRGFGCTKTWTPGNVHPFRVCDYIVLSGVILFLLCGIYVRFFWQWGRL